MPTAMQHRSAIISKSCRLWFARVCIYGIYFVGILIARLMFISDLVKLAVCRLWLYLFSWQLISFAKSKD